MFSEVPEIERTTQLEFPNAFGFAIVVLWIASFHSFFFGHKKREEKLKQHQTYEFNLTCYIVTQSQKPKWNENDVIMFALDSCFAISSPLEKF